MRSQNRERKKIIADEHVVDAYRRGHGRARIELMPGDIVTAQARETAERLNVELHYGPLPKPAAVRSDGATAMRRVLYRRHPGWQPPRQGGVSSTLRGSRRIAHLALIGAGGVGGHLAHLAADRQAADQLSVIDVLPGAAEALALDLQHAGGVTRSATQIRGGTSLRLAAGAGLIVVSAGRPRTPGMLRADLSQVNGRVIRAIGEAIAEQAPGAVVIVVSNPLDEMTRLMLDATGFPRARVMGMAGTLDGARFRAALARAAGVEVADVSAVTLGSHGDEMVPIVSTATIRERPLGAFLSEQQISDCRAAAINAGAEVVKLRRTGSATLAPAHASLELIDHVRGARAGPVPASVLLQGEYGIDDVVVGVPCRLGEAGLIDVVELPLHDAELAALRAAADAVRARAEHR